MSEYTPQKTCTKCGKSFPATINFFYKEKFGRDGLRSKCIKCTLPVRTRRVGRDPEKAQACRNRWIEKYPNKNDASKKKYYENNRDLVIQKAGNKQKNDPVWTAARNKKWKLENPDAVSAMSSNRRARIKRAGDSFNRNDVRKQYESQKGKCWWCGKNIEGRYHVDHRIPLSRGGSNGPDNIVISCPKCNLSKGGKLPHEWSDRLL